MNHCWHSLLLLAWAVALLGCKSGSFNPMAPFGTTRISPPGTGSYGAADPYYQPATPGAPASRDAIPRTSRQPAGNSNGEPEIEVRPGATGKVADDSEDGVATAGAVPQDKTAVSLTSFADGDAGYDIVAPQPPRSTNSRSGSAFVAPAEFTAPDAKPLEAGGSVTDIGELPEPPPQVRARLRNASAGSGSAGSSDSPAKPTRPASGETAAWQQRQ